MAGFSLHALLPASKIRITALHHHRDRLYVGTATGALRIYAFDGSLDSAGSDGELPAPKLLKTHAVYKRPIDQIGVLAHSQQIALLSDSLVTLYPLAELAIAKGRALTQARNAHAFAITFFDPSSVKGKRSETADGGESAELRDLVVVGCRKKVVVIGGGKNGLKDSWELTLPHSPRHVVFPPSGSRTPALPESIHLLYSAQSSVILRLDPSITPHLSIVELPTDPPPPTANPSSLVAGSSSHLASSSEAGGSVRAGVGGALSGLGGYVGLGGKAVVPVGTGTVGGEVLVARDDLGVFLSSEGNYTRTSSLQWPAPPDCLAFSNPYIFALSSSISAGASGNQAGPVLQVHLLPTLHLRQTIPLKLPSAGSLSTASITAVAASSSTPAAAMSPSAKTLFIATPTDKTVLQSEGSSIIAIGCSSVGDQVDGLVREGRVADAIGLVESVGEVGLDPSRRLKHLRMLQAVTHFAAGQYQQAMEAFLVHNVNPALVVSLYPEQTISGKLHRPRPEWMELFGAVPGARLEPDSAESAAEPSAANAGSGRGLLKSVVGLGGGLAKKPSLDSLRPGSARGADDDASSVVGGRSAVSCDGDTIPREALEALMYYLADRRQKLTGAISALSEPLPAESLLPALSALPADQLHGLPSVPMVELSNEELLRVAQVIYTALLKAYLVARPVLVGSLCRIENWCDVEEVEELLKAQKKFSDLIDLYQGKKMHAKALAMLHDLAQDEDDELDRFPPTIRYLQKLGPDYLDLIFDSAKWILNDNWKMGLQIFTADEPEVDALPRSRVMEYLGKLNVDACAGYLEHVIEQLKEQGADFHDKLADIYLERGRKGSRDGADQDGYKVLLAFLSSSQHYRANRLIQKVPAEDMPEARAILLGRLGRHDEALRIYVYRLKDYSAAEVHCAKVYLATPDPRGIYLQLLKLYLRPSPSDPVMLEPALQLIAKHGSQLDSTATLDLLPPLVTVSEVQAFFAQTLRDGRAKANQRKVVEGLLSARQQELDRALMNLQMKRVRVTDQRICPQCQKRLGQSAIAVHAPRGEVTHLHCKDQFSARLAAVRG